MRLEPKAVWVLQALARRAGEIVTRQELYEEVWRGRPVTDEVLSRCISLLRGALGDSPKSPAYIQTIPRVGYRLVATISTGGNSGSAEGAAAPPEQTGVPVPDPAPPAAAPAREPAAAGGLQRLFRLAAVSAAGGFWIVQGASALFAAPIARVWHLRALSALLILGSAAIVTLVWIQTISPRRRRWFQAHLLAGSRLDYALMAVLLMTVAYALQRPFADTEIPAALRVGPPTLPLQSCPSRT
jgi:DNA-binding winged helix-turn-helix (wHTH) protein